MSHGSLKDTVRTIQTVFANDANPLTPLPYELQQTVEAFLDRQQNIEDSESQKLHEELLSVYNKYVTESPDKHGPFVHILRLLRPAIRGEKRLEDWWTLVIRPTVDAIGHKRDTIEDAREFLLGVLVFDADEDRTGEKASLSGHFTKHLMMAYLARTKVPTSEGQTVSPEDEFIAQELEGILVAFGKKKPQELLMAIDEELVQPERRLQALSLLSSFVRLQPPHLHLVLETPVIQHLHNCILIDLSGTVVDLALTILIMFLPHITSSLYSSLPELFVIYARILCWDLYFKDGSEATKAYDGSPTENGGPSVLGFDMSWEPVHRLFNSAEAITPKANYLFTFLYGLFPLNFMNFIRKPRRYLKMKNYPGAEELNLYQDVIRKRTETHRSAHKLHSNFFTTTPEDELADNRLLKIDPADLVSECLGLCIAVANTLSDPGPPPTSKLPDIPKAPRKQSLRPEALLGQDEDTLTNGATSPTDLRSHNGSWRHTQSTTLTAASFPIDPISVPPRKSSQADLLSPTSDSSRETSPGAYHLEGTSPPKDRSVSRHRENRPPRLRKQTSPSDILPPEISPRLQGFAQALSRSPVPHQTISNPEAFNTAILQREVMLLKNDLNFERFQKAQYLAQIGQLQRKHLKEATSESQTQSLLNEKRTLQARLKKQEDVYAQLKRETATSRNQSKKYEEQLSQKLKAYREKEKQWQAEVQVLRQELDRARQECEELKLLVVDSEIREYDSRDHLSTLDVDLEEMNAMRHRLHDLEGRLQEYEIRELEVDRAREDHELLHNELQTAKLNLDSRDAELERVKKTYEQKFSALESRLRTAQQTPMQSGQLSQSMQQMIDSALAASNSRVLQLKRNYKALQDKYIELDLRNQDLERGRSPSGVLRRPSSVLDLTQYVDDTAKPSQLSGGREGVTRLTSFRRPHDFSEQVLVDEISPVDSSSSGRGSLYPERPTRFESLTSLRPLPVRGISPPPLDTSGYEHNLPHDFQAQSTGVSSKHSSQGLETPMSPSKVQPSADLRIHGRGGAQNVTRKTKDKDKKEKPPKTGGFRGLKGIM